MNLVPDNPTALTAAETPSAPVNPGGVLGSVLYLNARPLTWTLREPVSLL